ncbi:hypothetical protein [Conexibacter sp. DBS9H8]|uniref:cupin domain-containing protein n=1 Tax=Conexibacter sp. DBS9H8 TaxID=2937801 RepID=UPI00200F5C94|nr:hypothetical protein [Conexibacter sp. DBS9H8]
MADYGVAHLEEFDELYLVLTGSARFELAGESHRAPAGTFVHVRPGVMRTAFAETAPTTILAIGGGRRVRPTGPAGGSCGRRCVP